MAEHYTARIGFELGWDLAYFGRTLDLDSCNPDVRDGFRAGQRHFGRFARRPDRFELKWLQLRLGAFARHRIVQAEVTPDYLRFIDCAACPVTLTTLTHSRCLDSDWSVDRINNDGAYAHGNLMIISRRANKIKGRKTYQEVAALARDDDPPGGLSRTEWARLACLMFAAHHLDDSDLDSSPGPLLTRIPPRCPAPLYSHFQQALVCTARNAGFRNLLLRALNSAHPDRDQRRRLIIASERLALLIKEVPYAYQALADARVQCFLEGWFRSLPEDAAGNLLKIAKVFGRPEFDGAVLHDWALPSHGYFVDIEPRRGSGSGKSRPPLDCPRSQHTVRPGMTATASAVANQDNYTQPLQHQRRAAGSPID